MQKRGKFIEKDAAVIIRQILSCVNYLHNNKIVHRDIKPENILIEDAKRIDQIKIIDFETASRFNKANLTEKIGTPYYIAPEVLKLSYDYKCDIWSIGVIAHILLSSNPPFTGNSDDEILKKVSIGNLQMN